MTDFLLYIGRSGLYQGIFYAFYLLVMRRTTFFRLNRILLLADSSVCALLPLLRIRAEGYSAGAGALNLTAATGSTAMATSALGISLASIVYAVFIAGSVVVLLWTLVSALKMHSLVKSGERSIIEGYKTIILDSALSSFSFGQTIVICRKDLDENPAIFAHEKMHVKNRHYLDLYFFRVIQILWWWNPLVWIMRTELGLLHEYEADEGVLKQGVEASQYQMLLVRKAVGDERFVMASGFRYSKLKNRIAMMVKPESDATFRWTYLAVIPFLSVAAYACNPAKFQAFEPEELLSENESGKISSQVPSRELEIKPSFNGSDVNAFSFWVNERLHYPESAKAAGIQGRVFLSFAVDTDGQMKDIRILRGVHADLDAEALRVLESCTVKWTPGCRNGKAVKVTYTFPVIFQLK